MVKVEIIALFNNYLFINNISLPVQHVEACVFFGTLGTPPAYSGRPPKSCQTAGSPAKAECAGSIPKAGNEKKS